MYRSPSFGSSRERSTTGANHVPESGKYGSNPDDNNNNGTTATSHARISLSTSNLDKAGATSPTKTLSTPFSLKEKVPHSGSTLERGGLGYVGRHAKYNSLGERYAAATNKQLNPSRNLSQLSTNLSSRNSLSRTTSDGPLREGGQQVSSARREARDAFLRGETNVPPTKVDPSLRAERHRDNRDTERETTGYKEKEAMMATQMNHKPTIGHHISGSAIDNYVGYANLPNQVYRKSVKKGFEFTLMVVGESGLGKSTLINSMFLTDLYNTEHPGPSHRIKKTVNVESTKVLLKENGVQLRLTVVDTPGFGDAVDNNNCWEPVTNHIESKYDEFLNSESRVNRKQTADSRVHCCLYFISPNGHGLKPLDIEFMKRLHDKVNIIPLIAKADAMTPEECRDFKKTVLNEIAQHKIKIYEFPDCDDEEENKIQKKLKDRVPFAVVGSNTVVDAGGRKVRGRVYPWGVVEVENLEHNDFIALRNMLIRTHMQDLKDVTNNVHYENFRYNRLASVGGGSASKVKGGGKNPLLQIEEEKKEHETKMKKMEAEMEQVFEMKVKEKMQKLRDSEADLQKRAEQMKKQLEQQEHELIEKKKSFEKEREIWEEEERRRSLEHREKEKNKKKGLF